MLQCLESDPKWYVFLHLSPLGTIRSLRMLAGVELAVEVVFP